MQTRTIFLIASICVASTGCGSSSGSSSANGGSDGTGGPKLDAGGMQGMGAGDAGTGDGNMNPSQGGDGASGDGGMGDAGAPITGMEPECVTAFTRLAECYLSRDECVDSAPQNASTLGQGLSIANCATIAKGAGGLGGLSMLWNETTPCDTQSFTAYFQQLDMNMQIKDLCAAEPLSAADCTSSCTNIVPCASGIADMMISKALSDQMNCEANCTMQPVLSPLFRCALQAGSDCKAVQACFAP